MRRFFDDENGNIAIVGTILLLPILLLCGVSVDYSRIAGAQATLQKTLDSIPLSPIAAIVNRFKAEEYLESFMRANSGRDSADVKIRIYQDEIRIEVTDTLDTPFLGLSGRNSSKLTAEKRIKVPRNLGDLSKIRNSDPKRLSSSR